MRRWILILDVAAQIVGYGCNAVRRLTPFANRPSDVVTKLCANCSIQKYSTVESLLSTKGQLRIQGSKEVCNSELRGREFIGLDVKSEEVRGDRDWVVLDIHFKERANDELYKQISLVREQGVWRITYYN